MGRPKGAITRLSAHLMQIYRKLQLHEQQQLTKRRLSKQGKLGMVERWREHRIVEHMPLVDKVARQTAYMFPQVSLEDLVSAGYVGLVDAANRIDPERQIKFEAYAWWRIRGAIIDAHKRRQYQEAQHQSLEAISERAGYTPPALLIDHGPSPEQLADRAQQIRTVNMLLAELPRLEADLMRGVMSGMSVSAAARAVGMSSCWGRARFAEARDRLGAGMILR